MSVTARQLGWARLPSDWCPGGQRCGHTLSCTCAEGRHLQAKDRGQRRGQALGPRGSGPQDRARTVSVA